MDADPVALPGAQRVALLRVLDLDDLGAEIGELRGHRVAGDQPRQVDDPDAVERTGARDRTILRAGSSAVLIVGRQSHLRRAASSRKPRAGSSSSTVE